MNSEGTVQTLKTFEETLQRYKSELEKNPDSTFYIFLIKNTEEYIEKLKGALKSLKQMKYGTLLCSKWK